MVAGSRLRKRLIWNWPRARVRLDLPGFPTPLLPLIAVNHLEAHALTARLTDGVEFPFLLLLISGGHCQLLGVEGVGRFRL